MTFADLGLSDELLRAVTESGYSEPTPIQASAIPSVLMMRDLIGIAQTGTGKTASFVLPMIDILAHGRSRARMPRSLILEPTRELAAQVAENFEKYGKYHKLSMALLIGGVSMGDQVKALEKGVDVLIATPGRLMDLFGRGNILLTGCSLLVIDEADRMLDMGFIPDIENICTKLPSSRQTLLFSATMPPPIKKLADKFLSNPKQIEVARPASTNINITQRLVPVKAPDKREVLRTLLDRAWVRLWSASRTGRVRFALPCRPDLWLDTGCLLEGGRVRASGVIVALEHVLDVDAGRATTDIAVAVGMPGATPAAQPVWSLPASPYVPALPSLDQLSATIGTYVGGLASSPPFDAEAMIGLVTNEDGAEVPGRNYYPVGLTIGWPDLTADDRDPRELAAAAVISVTVPTDLLEIV